jgi:transaldolase
MLDNVKIFADGADIAGITELASNPVISGFTTNPTLMRQSGVQDYESFSRRVIEITGDRPLSLEVFADEFSEMERQARLLASWGDNVFVKIPVSNTEGIPTTDLVARLSAEGVKLNVTALLTTKQVLDVAGALDATVPAFVSVFAGRIADTGVDPVAIMTESLTLLERLPRAELIWASPRELLNVVQADQIGCHVITVTHDLLKKLPLLGKDLDEFSLDTVRMFADDAAAAGYAL